MNLLMKFKDFLDKTIFTPEPFDTYSLEHLIKYKHVYQLGNVYYFYEPPELCATRWSIACQGRDSLCERIDYAADKCKVICFAVNEEHNERIRKLIKVYNGFKVLKGVHR